MTTSSTGRIICLGAAFWDTIFKIDALPPRGGKVLPKAAVQRGSGMAVAAAVAIARLGGQVSLWTRVGDDALGAQFIGQMQAEGVAASHVRRIPGGHTSFSSILVDAQGERWVVPYAGASLDADAGWLPLQEVAGAAAVLADMRWVQGARALLQEARRLGVPTVLDADVAPLEDLRALMGLADHLLFSEPALYALVGHEHPAQALRDIAPQTQAQVIGVTLGARGSLFWQRSAPEELLEVPTLSIAAQDTLNAGDIWHGAYVLGLARQWPLARRARLANVAAAIKCETFGGWSGAPDMAQVLAREESLLAASLKP